MNHLPQIARLAEGLSVLPLGFPSAHDGQDVVKNERICVAAPEATLAQPIPSHGGAEQGAVAHPTVGTLGLAEDGKHLVSVTSPMSLGSRSDLLASFRGVPEALGRACPGRWISAAPRFDALASLGVVTTVPEGVVRPSEIGGLALGSPAGHAGDATGKVRGGLVDFLAADAAGDDRSGFLGGHGCWSHSG